MSLPGLLILPKRKKGKCCFQYKSVRGKAGPTGIEPAAYGLRVRRSSLTELRTRNVSLLKKGLLSNIELAVLLFQLDAVNTNNCR